MSSPASTPPKITFPHVGPMAFVGGIPNKSQDIPLCAVFMFLFVCGAAFHMTTFQINNRLKHKFIISGATFGFCMSRILTTTMRIVWACHPHNPNVTIASQVFNNAGVVLLFAINLIFAERILMSIHPRFTWNSTIRWGFKIYIGSIVGVLIIVINAVVLSFFTIDPKKQERYVQMRKFCGIYNAIFAFSSMLVVFVALLLPRREQPVLLGKRGTLQTQATVVVAASALLTFGAAFRAGVTFEPRLATNPAWFDSKTMFYITFFVVEILVVGLYAAVRTDQIFHIPNKDERLAAKERGVNAISSREMNGGMATLEKQPTVTNEYSV